MATISDVVIRDFFRVVNDGIITSERMTDGGVVAPQPARHVGEDGYVLAVPVKPSDQ